MGAIAALTGNFLATMDPVSFGVGEMLRDDMRRYARFGPIARSLWSLELAAMLSKIGHMAFRSRCW